MKTAKYEAAQKVHAGPSIPHPETDTTAKVDDLGDSQSVVVQVQKH